MAFYLATYLPMTVLAFLALGIMRLNGKGEELEDFKGLAMRSPMLAFLVTVAFASLAGLPLTAGFLGKMLVFVALVQSGHWFALTCAVVGAAAGFYYYFRIILAMYTTEGVEKEERLQISGLAKGGAVALGVVIVVLGVYPKPLQSLLVPATSAPVVESVSE